MQNEGRSKSTPPEMNSSNIFALSLYKPMGEGLGMMNLCVPRLSRVERGRDIFPNTCSIHIGVSIDLVGVHIRDFLSRLRIFE